MDEIRIADHSGLSYATTCYFFPKKTEELQLFLVNNPLKKIRIGGGLTGVSGGAVPSEDECFISPTFLNHIAWIDQDSGILEADSGVTMHEIDVFLKQTNWFFPSMPGMPKATVGGMVANNGGGPYSLKYGKISSAILSIQVVLANGQKCEFGGTATKISEGIDFKAIFIGSEGTLGIITKVIFRCQSKIKHTYFYRFVFEDFSELLSSVPVLLTYDALLLEAAEQDALHFSSNKNEHVIWLATALELPKDASNYFSFSRENETIMEERFAIGKNLQTYKPFIDLDVSFGLNTAKSAIIALKELLTQHNFENIFFGHAGDGNWHIHVFFNDDRAKWDTCLTKFDLIVRQHQGFISGEHGIGRIHTNRFRKGSSPTDQVLYKSIKQTLDPNHQFPSFY